METKTWARPGQALEDHLKGVGELFYQKALELGFPDPIARACQVSVAEGHDLGKKWDKFQAKLASGDRNVNAPHAPWGARLLYEQGRVLEGYLIAHHHSGLKGNLEAMNDKGPDVWNPRYMLSDTLQRDAYQQVRFGEEDFISRVNQTPTLDSLYPRYRFRKQTPEGRAKAIARYLVFRKLLGCLIWADHTDSALVSGNPFPLPVKLNVPHTRIEIDTYLDTLTQGSKAAPDVQALREALRTTCTTKQELLHRVTVLTAPTGSGKTLATILLALQQNPSQIIYGIPYLHITDKTVHDLKQVGLGVLEHTSVPNMDGLFEDREEFIRTYQESSPHLSNWTHPFIVTTLERLSRVFVGSNTTDVKRMLRLTSPDTTIIMDEIQSIPPARFRLYMHILVQLGCRVILMSATTAGAKCVLEQEGIPYNDLSVAPISRSLRQYEWGRVFRPNISQFKHVISSYNTIRLAESAFQYHRTLDGVYCYTSRLCPAHREVLLKEIDQRLLKGQPVRLICTQALQTGTDLRGSFPLAFVQMRPASDLLQMGGRVNRHGALQGGKVIVWHEKETRDSGKMYPDDAYKHEAEQLNTHITQKGGPKTDIELSRVAENLAAKVCEEDLDFGMTAEYAKTPEILAGFGASQDSRPHEARPNFEKIRTFTLIPHDEEDLQVLVDYEGSVKRIQAGDMTLEESRKYMVNIRVPIGTSPNACMKRAAIEPHLQECLFNFPSITGKSIIEKRVMKWTGEYDPRTGIRIPQAGE